MKITQVRNATIVIETKGRNIIVDPMLARKNSLPRLRFFRSNLRNPLVDLPPHFAELKQGIRYALITHCQKGHFDHLDRAGMKWLKQNQITTFCTAHDYAYLQSREIVTHLLKEMCSDFFDGTILQVPATHTTGWLSPFMEHGTGYFIRLPNEPSLYLMGDTVLTDEIRYFIKSQQPDYIVAPTGKAQFDVGAPLLLNQDEVLELAQISKGMIICNHMEALDHCRINRITLFSLLSKHGIAQRYLIPKDGETLTLHS